MPRQTAFLSKVVPEPAFSFDCDGYFFAEGVCALDYDCVCNLTDPFAPSGDFLHDGVSGYGDGERNGVAIYDGIYACGYMFAV